MIPATNNLVRTGAALLKHKVKMRMAELDMALLMSIEDRADDISLWAYDRRMRRQDSIWPRVEMEVTENRMLDVQYVGWVNEDRTTVSDLPPLRATGYDPARTCGNAERSEDREAPPTPLAGFVSREVRSSQPQG